MEPTHDLLPVDPAASTASAVQHEKEALRVQAAALVAQQSALTEEEIRLQQRRAALEEQEQQLAAHLEEKRHRLVSIRDEAREAHTTLVNERAAYERRVAAVMDELAQARREIADGQRQLQTERRRLLDLRRRLKRRWHRHWAGERAVMQRREAAVADQRRALETERARFQEERADLAEARLGFNGEMELGRREWEAQRESVRKERDRLEESAEVVAKREATLAEAARRLAEEQQQWDDVRCRLRAEAGGLENRVCNQRRNLADLEQQITRLRIQADAATLAGRPAPSEDSEPAAPTGYDPPAVPPPLKDDAPVYGSQWANVEVLAGELADQRLILAEQVERLAQAQQQWQQERDTALAELEFAGRRVEEEAQALWTRERALEEQDEGLHRRSQEIARMQRQLEAGRARLTAWAASWEGERTRFLAGIQAREGLVQQRLGVLMELRERWDQRRRRQVLFLRAQRNACEQLRRDCVVLRQEWLSRSNALEQKQRSLAEQALALEQYRHECITSAANPKAVEKRLERLRRRWTSFHASAERRLAKEREFLDAQAARLEERFSQLHQAEEEHTAQEADLSARQSAWEKVQVLAEIEQGKLRRDVQTLQRLTDHYEEQVGDLRDEVERLAYFLLDEGEAASLSIVQAA